jgi:predicted HAD superfamily Cof-like phosphohydrolase
MQTQPAYIDQIDAVGIFMNIAGQPIGRFNAEQAAKQIGFMCEELAETLARVKGGCINSSAALSFDIAIRALEAVAKDLKLGMHAGDVSRCDRVELLDGVLDTAWVSIGAAHAMSHNVRGAFEEIARANFDKFPNGQVTRDEGGKVVNPRDWRGPDLTSFATLVGMNSGFVLNNQGD